MPHSHYYGTYTTFICTDNKRAGILLGADCIIGDELSLLPQWGDKGYCIQVQTRFDQIIGYLDNPLVQEQIQLAYARNWTVTARVASIFYEEDPKPGHYGGEVVIFAYPLSEHETFSKFSNYVGKKLSEGIRPTVDLSPAGIDQLKQHNGIWIPSTRQAKLRKPGAVFLKTEITLHERLVEQARKKSIGCMIIGWGFIFVITCIILWILFKLFYG